MSDTKTFAVGGVSKSKGRVTKFVSLVTQLTSCQRSLAKTDTDINLVRIA
jgi:hypothetical protein